MLSSALAGVVGSHHAYFDFLGAFFHCHNSIVDCDLDGADQTADFFGSDTGSFSGKVMLLVMTSPKPAA
jgi:hypothetical protein